MQIRLKQLRCLFYFKIALMCLSPDFSNVNNRPYPRVKSNTTTSIQLLWDDPEWPSSCNGMSRPPLVYRVYIKDLSGVYVEGYNPKVCSKWRFIRFITIISLNEDRYIENF